MNPERSAEEAMQLAICGTEFIRQLAEDGLKQTRTMMEACLASAVGSQKILGSNQPW
jgi:hypothetical protein